MFRRLTVIILIVFTTGLLITGCPQSSQPNGNGLDTLPAAFSVSDLSIQPAEVEPNQTVTISVQVTNTGGSQESHRLVLMVDGRQEEDETVTIPAGSSQQVTFSITKREAGKYTISVDALSGSFIVAGNQKGNLAINFQLQDLDGNTVSLSELRGSPVIINFWGIWCGYCVQEMPLLQAVYEEHAGEGLVLLAINDRESQSQIAAFKQSNNLTFTMLLDSQKTVSLKYGIRGYPTTLFIDKDGIIRDIRIGMFLSEEQLEEYLELILP